MVRLSDARAWIGRGVEILCPHLAAEMAEGRNPARHARLKRLIARGRVLRARAAGDDALETALGDFWRAPGGDAYHMNHSQEAHSIFRTRHRSLLADLQEDAARNGLHFSRLVEIGCGVGLVLGDCLEELRGIDSFVGLDINQYAISAARERLGPDPRVRLEEADAVSWLETNPASGTVLLSYSGVMEYIAHDGCRRLYAGLARHAPAAVLLCEPVAQDHDLDTAAASYSFGAERSFSHNHRMMLQEAGFRIVSLREDYYAGTESRLVLIVALKKA